MYLFCGEGSGWVGVGVDMVCEPHVGRCPQSSEEGKYWEPLGLET